MRVPVLERSRLIPVLAVAWLLPGVASGQLRTVVSNEIAVSESEASLKLGFPDRPDLTIAFRDGQVFVGQDAVGTYTRRDDLDLAWRALLGKVITLDDGPLATALNDWAPPEGLTGPSREMAVRLDEILQDALAAPPASEDEGPQVSVTVSPGQEENLLTALLSRREALDRLADALEGTSLDRFTLKIGEDVEVGPGEVLDGNLILVDGNLEVGGRIDGNVIVAGGSVQLQEGGLINGDLKVADGAVERNGGTVSGSFLELGSDQEIRLEPTQIEDLRRELESEIRRDLSATARPHARRPNLIFGFLGNVGSAIAGILESLVTFIVLSILGVLAVHFQRSRLEVVATAARRAPVRAAVVGLAGGFFLLPLWIVGTIALAITIIGIPVLLAWVPLFPIAAGVAVLFGYLAVARNVGEWVAEQEYRGLEWIRGSNTFYTIVAGIGALLVPFVAENVSRILGFGFLTGLIGFAGSMVTLAAGAVGFGAVLLTRGGKIRPLESYYEFEEDYWADMEAETVSTTEPAQDETPSQPTEPGQPREGTPTDSEKAPTGETDTDPDSLSDPGDEAESEGHHD